MALSRIVVFGDGSTKQWAIPFALGYMKEADITCRVGTEVDGTGDPVYRPLTFLSPEWVEVGGTVPANLARVTFTRTVDREELIVNYSDGDVMNEANLDTAQRQAIMLVHEVLDGRFETFQSDFDLGGFKVTNLGAPTVSTDGANKAYVDAQISTGAANAAAAAASALSAAGSSGTAVAASTASGTARDQSVAAKDTAVAAASSTAGSASAAAGSASAAATSASNAANSATAASNSATASAGSASTASTANSNAQTAKTAAETAAVVAGTARDQSVAAKDLAVAANSTAQTAATTATTKATAASASAAAALVSENNVSTASVPVGMVFFSPKGTVPAGYLALEGASFDQTVYPALYSYLGVAVLPDYRDRVLRGAGTLAGLSFTTQEDTLQGHIHPTPLGIQSYGEPSSGADTAPTNSTVYGTHNSGPIGGQQTTYATGYPIADGINGTPRTSTETRVKAAIGKFVIKAYQALVNSGTADLIAIEAAQQYMVRFDAQVLSQAQKGQVLKNIGAAWEKIGPVISSVVNTPTLLFTDLDQYVALRWSGMFRPVNSGVSFLSRFSSTNGASWLSDTALYTYQWNLSNNTAVSGNGASSNAYLPFNVVQSVSNVYNMSVTGMVHNTNISGLSKLSEVSASWINAGATAEMNGNWKGRVNTSAVINAIGIITDLGNFDCRYFVLEGLRA